MTLLTIAIPTYNRLYWIQKSLPAIAEQVKAVPEGVVEFLVSDNASTDGTAEYLLAAQQKYPFLRLNRNAANICGEAHFYQFPQISNGRYVYMIGDDDVLVPGALSAILDALADNPDYLVLNFDTYDPNFQTCLVPNNLGVSEDLAFNCAEECLSHVGAMFMGFISLWVAKREFFNLISADTYKHFSQWGMSIQCDRYFGIARYPHGRLLAKPLLRNRQDGAFSHDYFEWFLHGGAQTLRYAVQHGILTHQIAKKLRCALLLKSGLTRIRYERRLGIFDSHRVFGLLRRNYGDLSEFWLLGVPTIFVPCMGWMLRTVHLLRRQA